jgi:hypothetical protein
METPEVSRGHARSVAVFRPAIVIRLRVDIVTGANLGAG